MPSILQWAFEREIFIVLDFLPGLPAAIAAITRFMLWDTDEFPNPVDPGRGQMRDLASTKS